MRYKERIGARKILDFSLKDEQNQNIIVNHCCLLMTSHASSITAFNSYIAAVMVRVFIISLIMRMTNLS